METLQSASFKPIFKTGAGPFAKERPTNTTQHHNDPPHSSSTTRVRKAVCQATRFVWRKRQGDLCEHVSQGHLCGRTAGGARWCGDIFRSTTRPLGRPLPGALEAPNAPSGSFGGVSENRLRKRHLSDFLKECRRKVLLVTSLRAASPLPTRKFGTSVWPSLAYPGTSLGPGR